MYFSFKVLHLWMMKLNKYFFPLLELSVSWSAVNEGFDRFDAETEKLLWTYSFILSIHHPSERHLASLCLWSLRVSPTVEQAEQNDRIYQNQKSPEDLLYIFAKAIRLKVPLALRGKLFSKNVLRDRVKLNLSALTDFLKDHRLSLTEEHQ